MAPGGRRRTEEGREGGDEEAGEEGVAADLREPAWTGRERGNGSVGGCLPCAPIWGTRQTSPLLCAHVLSCASCLGTRQMLSSSCGIFLSCVLGSVYSKK